MVAAGLVVQASVGGAEGKLENARSLAPMPERAARIEQFGEALVSAYRSGDGGKLAAFYAEESRLMAEFQPTVFGRDHIAAYHRAWLARFAVRDFVRAKFDRIDLGRRLVEDGRFTMRVQPREGGEAAELAGKYLEIWEVAASGEVRLVTQAWNLDAHVAGEERWRFPEVPGVRTALQARVAVRDGVSFELAALNRLIEAAIVQHDGAVWSLCFSDDAVLLPNFGAPCVGRREIDAYIEAHVKELPVFEKLDIRNDRIDDVGGGWVIEYASHVANWRSGDASGVSTGKNVRIWRREPGGGLRLFRQIGSYD
jgi:ketosteroid isomerase-like protein